MNTQQGTRKFRTARAGVTCLAIAGALTGIGSMYGASTASAAGTHKFPAKVDLNGRAKIGQSADAPGHIENQYRKGEKVPVTCQAHHDGALWDKTSAKTWVPDKYVTTGTDGRAPGVSLCSEDDGSGHRVHGRNNGPAGPTGGTRAQKISRVLKVAKSQTGKGLTYAWGAGGKGGPAYGATTPSPSGKDDSNRFGFDCSGYTLYAYWKGAGKDIGSYTGAQLAGASKVSTSSLKPGDLVFQGSPTDHVGIYMGKGKVAQAATPRNSHSVRISAFHASDWNKQAARPFK